MYKKILLGVTILLLAAITIADAGELQGNETQAVNVQINYNIFAPAIAMSPSSTGTLITWSNGAAKDNRVYYGLNEADVNSHTNGAWSHWDNNTADPLIRLSGLKANTTYYYKEQTWSGGVPDDSAPVKSITIDRPRVWTGPAEVMISPAGWATAPDNFKTVNISAAPLDINGRPVKGLSLTAVIYNGRGEEVDRVDLTGDWPYYTNYVLRELHPGEDGAYYVKIEGYPFEGINGNMTGEFSALRWGCVSCHSSGGANYPSTFSVSTVHPEHTDTTQITLTRPGGMHGGRVIHNVAECDDCHPPARPPYWVPHPASTSAQCVNCHKSPTGGSVDGNPLVGEVVCADCHDDSGTNENLFAQRYGTDVHKNKPCTDCHTGTLNSLNTQPSCTSCHPRPGKEYLTSVPSSIREMTHSSNKTVACGMCHNSEHDIRGLTNDSSTCRNCHTGITHDSGNQCTSCHGSDPHNITAAGGETCIECHGTDYPGANPMAMTTLVNISAFNESIHQNINQSMPEGAVTNEDCWQCHYLKSMSRNEVRGCNYCHSNVPQWHGNANITTNWSELW